MKGWELKTLESIVNPGKGMLVSGPFGSNISSKFFVDEGVPVIRGNNLTNGKEKFIDNGFVYITEEKAYELRGCEAKEDDIVITAAGTLGQVGIMPRKKRFSKYIISNKQIRLRCNLDLVCPLFIYYKLVEPGFNQLLMSQNKGSSIPLLTLGSIKWLPLMIPTLSIQRRIASILSAYDDLIENNLKRIKLLEEIAQRTYEEWFVKFRVNGEQLPIDQNTGLPVGWDIVKLSDVCSRIQSGGTPSRSKNSYWENGTMNWFKTKELQDSWLIDSEEKISIEALNNSSAKTFPPNTILMAIYASPTLGRLGLLQKESSCNQAAIGFICKEGTVSFQWLYFKLFELRDRFNGIARGAGQQNISGELVKDQTIVLPKYETIKEFTDFVSPIMFQQLNLQKQNLKLKESRDILLPKLMNGTIKVD